MLFGGYSGRKVYNTVLRKVQDNWKNIVNPRYSEGFNLLLVTVTMGRIKISTQEKKQGAIVGTTGGSPYIVFSWMKEWHIISQATAHSALLVSIEINEQTGAKKCQSHSKYVFHDFPKKEFYFILFIDSPLYFVDRCII